MHIICIISIEFQILLLVIHKGVLKSPGDESYPKLYMLGKLLVKTYF